MENPDKKALRLQTFGSFFLGESEFAIEAGKVREVVNSPEKWTSLPLAPDYLLGIFNLRGSVIPVLDLRVVFGRENLDPQPQGEPLKVAIIEYGRSCLGVLFDRTGEIFKSNEEEKSEFVQKTDPESRQIISGAFKKNQGKRIVQILDIEALFQLKGIPYEEQGDSVLNNRRRLQQKRGTRNQCISFLVGNSRCALPIDSIREILKVESVSESSLASSQCIGTLDLRGTTLPIVDFAALLGFRNPDRSEVATKGERRIVVMKLGDEVFGLLVDNVESIISYFSDEVISFPVIAKSRTDMIVGCLSRENEHDILLLNSSNILTNSEIVEITRGHSKIFKMQSPTQGNSALSRQTGLKKTVITFTLDSCFAVGIDEVREIIEYPKNLLHPPGLPGHFRGVLNLRGELVTIVDARAMYSLEAKELPERKVLIFMNNNVKYGLVVDSVDGIVSFHDKEKLNLPEVLYRGMDNRMIEDIREVVEVDHSEAKKSLLILNTSAVYSRFEKATAA